jgi:hypothetical protein
VVVFFLHCLIDNFDISYNVSSPFQDHLCPSDAMEVNVILDEASSPCREASLDDSMVSMKFSTPAHLTISRRHVVSLDL